MEQLVVQAAGLFIYAATVVKYFEPLEHLDMLLSVSDSATPQTSEEETPLLDNLYLQVLSDSLRGFKDNFFHTGSRSCTPFSATWSVHQHPLSPNFSILAMKLTLHFHTPQSLIVFSCAFTRDAVFYPENDKAFSSHKSFTDFMFDQNRAKKFWCDQAEHHRLLTGYRFCVMDAGLKFNIANITSSFLLDRDNSALPYALKQNIPPVLSYSCRNWDHLGCRFD